MQRPRVLILHANGSNRDHDLAQAFHLAGAQPEIQPLQQLREQKIAWHQYQLLALPGGFSYADVLGAGRLWAFDLQRYFLDELQQFIAADKPVIGICNGFQALVKAGVLPDFASAAQPPLATLAGNAQGSFECRWVYLQAPASACLWTQDISELIYCPVAHGEGRFCVRDSAVLSTLQAQQQIALVYARADGQPAHLHYPDNPNGSVADIAGICNPQGNVLGLMPHPENHIFPYQHPCWTRGESGQQGLALFVNGVRAAG